MVWQVPKGQEAKGNSVDGRAVPPQLGLHPTNPSEVSRKGLEVLATFNQESRSSDKCMVTRQVQGRASKQIRIRSSNGNQGLTQSSDHQEGL